MSSFTVNCPTCQCRVVWRFFYPKTRADYCCQKCGHCWKEPLEELQGQYGAFLGKWQDQEMTKLEENLASVFPFTDWTFFKGRSIYTAWQASVPHLFISTKSVDELTYWVALATQSVNESWYETYRRLADGAFRALDLPHS